MSLISFLFPQNKKIFLDYVNLLLTLIARLAPLGLSRLTQIYPFFCSVFFFFILNFHSEFSDCYVFLFFFITSSTLAASFGSHCLCGILVDSGGRYSARKRHLIDAALFVISHAYENSESLTDFSFSYLSYSL